MVHGDPYLMTDILAAAVTVIGLIMGVVVYVWKDDRRRLDAKADKTELKEIRDETKTDIGRIWKELSDLNRYLRGEK